MYHALYRKYRPQDFDSVVGQESIIKTLKNSIIHNNFSHAYMFFGSRGTGKTSISKIFARNINCLSTVDGLACKKCKNCEVSFSKDCVDIIEIDAASNNGVDEIRELKNKISLVPTELKYKVYIIDEVHMLSIGAFNALLKTLEEPPEHAIFILATTDPQKVPETIVSRCQCFSFKRISSDIIRKRLEFVCNEENIQIDSDVIEKIAILSDGGMRDALGMLDKLISYTSDKITINDFIELNGIISDDELYNFLLAIMDGNISQVLLKIGEFDTCGKNLIQILIQLLNYSRNLIIDYYLSSKSVSFSIVNLQNFTNLLNEKMFDIKKSSNTKIYFEMIILKFINDFIMNVQTIVRKEVHIEEKEGKELNNISDQKSSLVENNSLSNDDDFDFDSEFGDSEDENYDNSVVIGENSVVEKNICEEEKTNDISYPKILNMDKIMKVRVNNTLALADKKLLTEESNKFNLLKDFTFDQEIGYIVCNLLDSKLRAVSNDSLIISFEYDSIVEQNLLIIDKIIDVYNKITSSDKKIAIISDSEWEKVKNEYISNLKNHVKYEVLEEPKVLFEENDNNDIISSSAINLFGDDIVEIE